MKSAAAKSKGIPQPLGVGIDIVDIARFRQTLERRGRPFIDRIFLPSEQTYCTAKPLPWVHYAGRFAAKEAIAKAFGTGIGRTVGWLDLEVVAQTNRAPRAVLSARLQRLAKRRGIGQISLSIAHTRATGVAVAILAARV